MGSIRESDSPPSYDLSQIRDALAGGGTTGGAGIAGAGGSEGGTGGEEGTTMGMKKKKTMTVESRIAWSCALGVPLFAAVLLLFLITASSSTLRVDFSVIKIDISSSTVDGLFEVMSKYQKNTGRGPGSGSVVDEMKGAVGIGKRAGEGFMTLGIWGWCVATRDYSR